MAREVVTELVDDVDGVSRATQTVTFTVQGRSYELDLNPENARAFFIDMDRWTTHARRTGVDFGQNRSPARRDPAQTRAIRQWARDNGYDVKPNARIPADVEAAYHARAAAS